METPPRVADAPAPDADPHEIAETGSDRRPSPDPIASATGQGPARPGWPPSTRPCTPPGVADFNLLPAQFGDPAVSGGAARSRGASRSRAAHGDIALLRLRGRVRQHIRVSRPGPVSPGRPAPTDRGAGSSWSSPPPRRRCCAAICMPRSWRCRPTAARHAAILPVMTMSSAVCIDHPVCAVTLAAYRAVGWSGRQAHRATRTPCSAGGART